MTIAETMWLRGQAAQRGVLNLFSYNAAFLGTTAVQAMGLGLSAPRSYWAAMSRAAATPSRSVPKPPHAPEAAVLPVALAPVADAATPREAPVAPAPAVTPSPHLLDAPRGGAADDLTTLKGVGPKLALALNEFGIYHFDQIAGLDEAGIAWLDAQQKGFRMICARHDIVAQARAMA